MTDIKLKVRNSMVLPSEEVSIVFQRETTIKDLKKIIREELEIENNKEFVVFLRAGKKWFLLEDNKTLDEYPLNKGNLRLDVKRKVSTQKIRELVLNYKAVTDFDLPYGVLKVKEADAEEVKEKLVEKALDFVLNTFHDPMNAMFKIPNRSKENIGYEDELQLVLLGRQMIDRQFRSLSSVKTVAQMTTLMKIMYDILARDIHATKRDIFYMAVNEFEHQGTSDQLIEDVGAMLQITRPSMNVWATSKGVVIGRLSFEERGDFIDCRKIGSGKSIAPNIDDITNLESDAEFVLVIEKDAVFNRLAEDHFYDYIPSILVTAKGQPDMATREFLKKINDELQLPILAIMDADVYGFEIMRVYTVGSKALSFEARNLAVPNIKWLGLLPKDLLDESGFQIPKSVHIKMSQNDIKKAKKMLEEDFVLQRPKWREQLQILLDLGSKAEIQALNARDPQFITNHYLPEKIETGDFI